MHASCDRDRPERPRTPAAIDSVIRAIAARQHGVVGRGQLVRAGVPEHAIDYRRRTGRLTVLQRGTYAVGPVAGPLAREWSALLYGGSGGALSHRTAGVLLELLPTPRRGSAVDVSSSRNVRGRARGIRFHRIRSLAPDEVVAVRGLPVTAAPRTLVDLSAVLRTTALERALARARRLYGVTPDEVAALLRRHRRRPGIARLRALHEAGRDPAFTRSEAEVRFLTLIREARLSRPCVNAMLHGLEVDFAWPRERLVVEIDGFEFHGGSEAFEEDRRRDATLVANGFRVLRLTWRRLVNEPYRVLVDVSQALVLSSRAEGG